MRKPQSAVPFVLVLASVVVATLWGLASWSWPEAIPFSGPSLQRYLGFLAVSALTMGVCLFKIRLGWTGIGFFYAFALALLAGAVWALLVTIWFGVASALLGRGALSALRSPDDEQDWSLSILVGAGLYGTAVAVMAHFPINYPGIYGIALAVPLFVWRRRLVGLLHLTKTLFTNTAPTGRWLQIPFLTIASVHFVVALMPEVSHDALTMHMFIPAHMAARHEWGFDAEKYVWATWPLLGDWIYSSVYMFGGETAARLTNVGFVLLLTWQVRALTLWICGKARAALWASLVFLSTPLTFTESSSLFIDSIWASFVVGGVFVTLLACSSGGRPKSNLPVAGFLLGCAASAKAVTLAILPAILVLMLCRPRAWLQRKAIGSTVTALALFVLVGHIPYAISYYVTGNPVFPFFNSYFESPLYPAVDFQNRHFGTGVTWDLLYRVTFFTDRYIEGFPGGAGFHWLLLLVPASLALLLTRGWRGLTVLFLGVGFVLLTFYSTSYLRYVFPSCALLTAVSGYAFSYTDSLTSTIARIFRATAFGAVLLNVTFLSAAAAYRDFNLGSLGSNAARTRYLESRLPLRNAVETVNHLNTNASPVAVFSAPLTAGLNADAIYANWYNSRFSRLVGPRTSEHDLVSALQERQVEYVLLDSNWRSPEWRRPIELVTKPIAWHGPVSVRTIRQEQEYATELLKSTDFGDVEGWVLADGSKITGSREAVVRAGAHLSQAVPVTPGRRYRLEVNARCLDQPTQGRLQVNWLGLDSKMIKGDIRVFDCAATSSRHSMDIIAPGNAAYGVVYASGHTAIPMIFEGVSFKQ